jgi:hypothetical protein
MAKTKLNSTGTSVPLEARQSSLGHNICEDGLARLFR